MTIGFAPPPYRLKTAGLTVNIRVEGTGPPLLFLGGSNFDLSLKAAVFDSALPRHFTVAAADPRGLGGTDAPQGDWTMQDYAQDALDVLDALGWARADVLGESFGAMVAMHLAACAPERVSRLALAAGSPGGAGGSSYPVEQFQQISDPHARARSALEIMDCRFADLLMSAPDVAQAQIEARVAVEAAFRANRDNAAGYPRLLGARAGHDAWAALPGIQCPTLVFAGRFDRQAPPERAGKIAGAMPDATLYVVDGGHNHCFAMPEPVLKIVEHWT
jgi:3-oxoadipate enol-lactonase